MDSKEMQLASDLLDQFSDHLINKGCNDWEFPGDWSNDEKARFVYEYHCWNGDLDEYSEDFLVLSDFEVAAFLSYKLSKG